MRGSLTVLGMGLWEKENEKKIIIREKKEKKEKIKREEKE